MTNPGHEANAEAAPSGRRLRKAGALFGVQEVALRLVTIGISLISARVVGPGGIGILAFAVIVSALQTMVATYPETAAVYLPKAFGAFEPARKAAWLRAWLTLIQGVTTLVLTSLICRTFSVDEAEASPLIRLLLILPVLEACGTYSRVVLQRTLQLERIARIQVFQVGGYGVLGVFALASGFGIRGLAWAQVSATAATALWYVLASRRFPGTLETESKTLPPRAFLAATMRLFLGGFGGFLAERIDNLLVSRTLGSTSLGLYSVSYSASRLGVSVLTRAVNSTLGPMVPQMDLAGDPLRQLVRRAHRLFHWIAGLGTALIVSWAPLAIPLVLGPKWVAIVHPLQIMALCGLFTAPMVVSGVLLTASGLAHFIAIGSAFSLSVLIIAIPALASRFGLYGAAIAEELSTMVVTAVLVALVRRHVPIREWFDLKSAAFGVVGLLPSLLVGVWSAMTTDGTPMRLVGFGIIGTIAYISSALLIPELTYDLRALLGRKSG